jgi:hypothetical protein
MKNKFPLFLFGPTNTISPFAAAMPTTSAANTPASPPPACSSSESPEDNEDRNLRLGLPGEAKMYREKIQHETLRISVIERLENYFKGTEEEETPTVVGHDAGECGRPPTPNPSEEREWWWEDISKRIFLWYYHIYLVYQLDPLTDEGYHFKGEEGG